MAFHDPPHIPQVRKRVLFRFGGGYGVFVTRIVIAADSNYLPYAKCTLAQLAVHSTSSTGVVLLKPADVRDTEIDTLRRFADEKQIDLDIVGVSEIDALAKQGRVRARGHVSTFTYSKLFISELLADEEILYLDVDTLVRDNIDSLVDYVQCHPIAAVRELGSNGVGIFGSTRVPYFNAGVLRMSLKDLRAEGFADTASEYLDKNPARQFQDQDVLNWFFHDRHDVLPHAFNVFDSFSELKLPAWKVLNDPAIVHFVGPNKPWTSAATSPYAREWRAVHASNMSLGQLERREYIEAVDRSWQANFHTRIVFVRYSHLGQIIRARLPVTLKDKLNRIILGAIPPKTLFKREVLNAMNNQPLTLRAQQGSAVVQSRQVTVNVHVASDVRVDSKSPRESKASRHPVGSYRRSKSNPQLVLVCSFPRSGTNALNSLLRNSFMNIHIEGEMFYGHLRKETLSEISDRFPWIGSAVIADRAMMTTYEKIRAAREFRLKISSQVVEVTEELLRDRDGITVIKVFPNHLEAAAFERLMRELRPRVIVLRRQLLFSYVSFLKATASNAWFREDSTNIAAQLSESEARSYVRQADEWFDLVTSLTSSLGLERLDVSFSDLFESMNPLPTLRNFLAGVEINPSSIKEDGVRINTVRQDRRTDQSLAEMVRQIGELSPETVGDLLRLPGKTEVTKTLREFSP